MKVSCLLLHGTPFAGKTSIKRLILNKPPLLAEEESSTGIMEDRLRAFNAPEITDTSLSYLEEVKEEKMIEMVQNEMTKIIANSTPVKRGTLMCKVSSLKRRSLKKTTQTQLQDAEAEMPEVLGEIAIGLVDLDMESDSQSHSVFNINWIHLVDSGGQPQFFDLLPLLFRPECHHHIVVIHLDEKLNAKPHNCYRNHGKVYNFPDHLALTSFQLIERVCQLAARAFNSWVFVVGTHINIESQEEPLAVKNKMLEELIEKYPNNLVHKNRKAILYSGQCHGPSTVGKERNYYASLLQQEIHNAPILGTDQGHEDGIPVPLQWTVLGLELRRHSKGDVIEKNECTELLNSIGIIDPTEALAHSNELGDFYHYPEAIPDKIFASITPITSWLSKLFEALFVGLSDCPQDEDYLRMRQKGEMTRRYFEKLLPNSLSSDILTLFRALRIIFEIDTDTYFIPNLLPVDIPESRKDCYDTEPSLLFWSDENGKVRILPQSYFHAMVIELLQREETSLCNTTHAGPICHCDELQFTERYGMYLAHNQPSILAGNIR